MTFQKVNPDMVRYEMRMVQGQDVQQREQKRPGGFGRFLSGIGRVLGSMAMPLSIIFPPAAIAAAGMYGVGQIGNSLQKRAYAKSAQQNMQQQMMTTGFPGMDFNAVNDHHSNEKVGNVLRARGETLANMANRM